MKRRPHLVIAAWILVVAIYALWLFFAAMDYSISTGL